jgi:peptide/nickel transport system ATP-binding protein
MLAGERYPVLNQLDFQLQPGKTFAIVGESGCGKSIMALALNQLLPPNAAYQENSAIFLGEEDLLLCSDVQMQTIRGKRIGMVFQEPMTALNPVFTIGQQLTEIFNAHHVHAEQSLQQHLIELLKQVGISDPVRCLRQYPHELSGGMKQRVVIAMAIALKPDILIADEPTTALDVTIQAQILDLLRSLQVRYGMAILLISHDLGVVSQMADDVAVMYAGQFVEQGPTQLLIRDPKHPYTQQLLAAIPRLDQHDRPLAYISGMVPGLTEPKAACPFANRCPYAWSRCWAEAPLSVEVTPLHRVSCHLYTEDPSMLADLKISEKQESFVVNPASNDHSEIAFSVEDARCYFPIKKGLLQRTVAMVKAVDGVSLCLKKGKTLALVGESGCGKTTLGKALSGLLPLTKGDIRWGANTEVLSATQWIKQVRQQLQMVFQDPFSSLNPRMMISQILSEGLLAHGLMPPKKEQLQLLQGLLDKVGLPQESLQRYPHEFSGGQRQRLSIARALAVNPSILICDEPTSALDVSVQAKILNLLKELQQKDHLAYLFITHDLAVVGYMADEVAVMYLGRIVEYGLREEILKTPKHPYTQALLRAKPMLGEERQLIAPVIGEPPSPIHPPVGCHFAGRCPFVMKQCLSEYPSERSVSATHQVRCFLYSE